MSHKRLLAFLIIFTVPIVTSNCRINKFEINVDTTGRPLIVEDWEKFSPSVNVIINGEKIGLEVSKKDYTCTICEAIQNKDKSIIALSVCSWPTMMNINGLRLPNLITFECDRHILLFRGKKLIYSRDMSKEHFIFQGWNEKDQFEIAAENGAFAVNKWGREVKK